MANYKLNIFQSNYEACENSNLIAICTEWDEFLKYNWETIFDSMKREPWVFDGRNIINTDKLKAIGFNTYSIEEVKKHTSKKSLWTHFRGDVYDITKYIKHHPGGYMILRAGGKNLEEVWKKTGYSWHLKNTNTMNELKKLKIGKLRESFENKTVYDNLIKINEIIPIILFYSLNILLSKFFCCCVKNSFFRISFFDINSDSIC